MSDLKLKSGMYQVLVKQTSINYSVSSFYGSYIQFYPKEYNLALLMPIITHKSDLFDRKWLKIATKILFSP